VEYLAAVGSQVAMTKREGFESEHKNQVLVDLHRVPIDLRRRLHLGPPQRRVPYEPTTNLVDNFADSECSLLDVG
jgi:hypothetical protein